jgi:hypothetical protein
MDHIKKQMKGLYQITAQKGKKIISSEVYGDSDDKASLFARLMNRHKIVHSQRPLFKIIEIKLNKDMSKSSFKFRDYQKKIINDGSDVLIDKGFLYLAMEVRTGKTLTSLGIADKIGVGNVLFLTKKKAISTIESDYAMLNPKYNLVVMNYESIHKLPQDMWDFIVCDEAHSMGAFPKPSKRAKQVRELIAKNNPYVILMSGTPTPESFSQMYHQVYGIKNNPFKQYKNFYRFCDDYVRVTEKKINGLTIRDYSNGNQSIIDVMKAYTISYSQKEAGFKVDTREHKLYVKMDDVTYKVANKLKKDLVVEGKDEAILGDTSVKLMTKLHQIYSGTVKFESGNSKILDLSKASFIHDNFGDSKVGIFYKFKEEYNALKEVYGDNLCTELDEFNTTDKTIALQIQSGREGISLRKAKALVYYNIDFSATSYWQSRDRMTTKDRLESDVYWVFAEGGIEDKIYKAVSNKKDYTTKHFKKDLLTL